MLKPALMALSAASLAAVPTAANAQYYGRYYGRPSYANPYYAQRTYGGRYYADRYYGGRNYHYRHYRHRCGNGTAGLIVGGAAGALLGSAIERGSRSRYSWHRPSGTTGAIIGGALGALVGREIARGC